MIRNLTILSPRRPPSVPHITTLDVAERPRHHHPACRSTRMACARCDLYIPKPSSEAQLLEAKDALQRMLVQIPLTDEERAAAEHDHDAVDRLLGAPDRHAHTRRPHATRPQLSRSRPRRRPAPIRKLRCPPLTSTGDQTQLIGFPLLVRDPVDCLRPVSPAVDRTASRSTPVSVPLARRLGSASGRRPAVRATSTTGSPQGGNQR